MNTLMYILVPSINLLIAIAGIVMNVLLLMVLCKIRIQRKSYFSLVKSLTVADLGLSLSLMIDKLFFSTFYVLQWICRDYFLYVMLLNLSFLAAEHYVAIIKPLHYTSWIHCRFITIRLLITWIVPILMVYIGHIIPVSNVFITYDWKLAVDSEEHILEIQLPMKDAFRIPFVILVLILMTIVYVYIYIEVRKQQRLDVEQNQNARRNNRALVTTVFNLLSFFLCWLPPVVVEVIFQIYKPSESDDFWQFYELTKNMIPSIVYLNSIFDPMIYALRLTDVWKKWSRMFCCCCRWCNCCHDRLSLQQQLHRQMVQIVVTN